jgi:hypothetical protein
MRRAIALSMLCCGCLQGVPDDIGCVGDDTCPTGYYCDDSSICSSLSDGTPATLLFGGVGLDPGTATGKSLTLPLTGTMFYLSFSNTGTHDASTIGITFDSPACMDLHSPTLIPPLPAGQSESVQANSANPVLPCPDADVTVSLDIPQGSAISPFHRTSSGTFRVHVGP